MRKLRTSTSITISPSALALLVLAMATLMLLGAFSQTAYALPAEKASSIQTLLDDAARISGTPGISVAVIFDGQTHFFNTGYTVRGGGDSAFPVSEHTSYEIASLSKAFTALGILLLEEQGLLSISDYIGDHLPWLYFKYQNEVAAVTISDLLNHSSGLTDRHQGSLRGEGEDALRKTIEPFVGASLGFLPGTDFAYNNHNYNILGLIIEEASGQSYESFMTEQVLQPLGMYQTFLHRSEAIAAEMAQAHRNAFFTTFVFDAPVYGGMKPTGYIISSAYDMARWMGIHLGLAEDIPEVFVRVIEKSHQAQEFGAPIDDGLYYFAGWIGAPGRGLGHAGGVPGFTANVLVFPEENQGAIFLANASRNIDEELVWYINDVLDGDLEQSYVMGADHVIEIFNSTIVIASLVGIVILLAVGIRSHLKEKPKMTKSKMIKVALCAALTLFMTFRLLNYPNSMGVNWEHVFDWNPPSVTVQFFVMPVFCAVLTWYNFTVNPKPKKKVESCTQTEV